MSKRQLKLWKSDNPEPQDYNHHFDPTQQIPIEDELQSEYIERISQSLCDWIANQSTEDFETRLLSIKSSWVKSSGSLSIFEDMVQKAFLQSGFYKTMSQGI